MLKSVIASLVLATLLHAHAFAQSAGQLGPGQLWANPTASQARGKATGLSPYFDFALGSTANGFPARISGNWTESLFGSSFAFSGSTLNLQPSAASTLGGVNSFTCGSHTWANALSTLGVFSCTQPALSDLPTGTQDTVLGYWTSTVLSASTLPNCSNALTYSTSTHTWGCNSSAGTGTVTNIATAGLASGGPITSNGTITGNLPARYWSGGQNSNDVGTPNTKVDIAAGEWRDSTDAVNIFGSNGIIDFTTTGANGLDTGTIAASTKYYTFAICKSGGASPAYLASTSPTAPALPSTYTNFRRIGMVMTDASAHILPFTQVNDHWYWNSYIQDLNSTGLSTSAYTNETLSVPAVQGVEALISVTAFVGSGVSGFYIAPAFVPDFGANGWLQSTNSTGGSYNLRLQVSSSAQIKLKLQQAGNTIIIYTYGWIDPL